MNTISQNKHRGPHLGMLAIIFTLLFNTGLSFVISLSGTPPYFPGPWESAETIAVYFQNHSHDVLMCAFFQLGSAIPLGILTASMVSRLWFLGSKASGSYIALFGGFMAALDLAISAFILWVMAYPSIAQNTSVTRALYYLGFAIGGVGYSVPMGLLIAGVSVTTGFMKLLPKWMVGFGILLALIGEASSLSLVFPKLLFLIPLTRFPGFIWLIIAGFMLPKEMAKKISE
ncbi:MAG TPA: hypothetical protein VNW99_04175 [Cytophagaceae bacterium]|jgi:hypothetical protein|nr:hypothetical protein [Cytophagaceae bacterium]